MLGHNSWKVTKIVSKLLRGPLRDQRHMDRGTLMSLWHQPLLWTRLDDAVQASTGPQSVCSAVTEPCSLTEMFVKPMLRDEGSMDHCLRAPNYSALIDLVVLETSGVHRCVVYTLSFTSGFFSELS